MTTLHHTQVTTGAAVNAATVNNPLGQLDAAITTAAAQAQAAIDAALLNGTAVTQANGAASAGQKVVTVDDSGVFVAGAKIEYLLAGGILETNTIATVDSSTQITLTTNIGTGGIADNAPVTVIPAGFYNARVGTYNVRDFGAVGDGTTDDTAAISAALAAMKAGVTREKRRVLLFSAGSVFKVTSGLDLTNCERVVIDGNGSTLKSYGVNGKAVLDMTGSAYVEIRNLTFDSDATNPPACHIMLGRSTDSGGEVSGAHLFHNVRFLGYWTIAAVYNVSSELNTFDNCYLICQGPATAKYGIYYSGYDDESLASEFVTRSATASASTLWLRSTSIIGSSGVAMIPVFLGGLAGNVKIDGAYFAAYGAPAIKTYGNIYGLEISALSVEGSPTCVLHMTARSGAGTVKDLRMTSVAGTYSNKYMLGDTGTTVDRALIEDLQDASGVCALQFATLQYARLRNWNQVDAATMTCVNLYESELWLLAGQTITVSGTKRNVTEWHFTASDSHIETTNLALKLQGGSLLHKVLTTTFNWDLNSQIADGAVGTKTFALTGVSQYDCCIVAVSVDATGVILTANPYGGGGGGTVMAYNRSGGAWPNPGATITVRVTTLVAE